MVLVFSGTIPEPMRSIVSEWLRRLNTPDLWVACSGNFTIERIAHPFGCQLHGNDVNPYTSGIGLWLTGQPVPFRLNDEGRRAVGWLEPYLDDGVSTVATLMIGSQFLNDVHKRQTYYRRMVEAHRIQFEQMHAATVARLDRLELRLASYYLGDVREYLRRVVPADGPVVSFPPFYRGGYEVMFKGISRYFDWPSPTYDVLDDQGIQDTLGLIMDRPHWLMAVPERIPQIEERVSGYVRPQVGSKPFYVYTSDKNPRLYMPKMFQQQVKVPRFGPDDELTPQTRITLHPVNQRQMIALRSQYMNPLVDPAKPSCSLLVCADGRMVGAFSLDRWHPDPGKAYLMTDFPVPGTRYPRLSKLIVMCAMSREARSYLQRLYSREFAQITTTAFTHRPISAKYGRGIPTMRLYLRKDPDHPDNYSHKGVNSLTYLGSLGDWSAQEAFDMWLVRHGMSRPREVPT
jgi:hypothetical protein